ncbi:MAG: DUF423 domain-containing protein [Saprospiraceae bacterium]|nr:DUF423 domain-containing protein [Saprospiraceae bacterium]
MYKKSLFIVGFLGMTAVALGAFGAHGLKILLEPEQMETFRTGVLYHFIHTLAMLALVVGRQHLQSSYLMPMIFFTIGIFLFCGSLYLLSCKSILGLEHWTFLGPVTPIGGMFFIAGWMSLMFLKVEKKN